MSIKDEDAAVAKITTHPRVTFDDLQAKVTEEPLANEGTIKTGAALNQRPLSGLARVPRRIR